MNGIVRVFMVMGAWSLLGVSSAMAADAELQLGDAAGVDKLAVKDSLGVTQFSVNSDGAVVAAGKITAPNVGVVYTRWGRTVCPAGNTLVYDGYAAGAEQSHSGSGANRLCLSKTPTWDTYNDANLDHSLLYGAEYETSGGQLGVTFDALQDYEVPCAVCLVTDAGAQFMHSGSQTCPAGWTAQYAGYLMGQHYTQSKSEFVCVDRAATSIGSAVSNNGALFYSTEGECGSLPCLPYVQNREITCSVCTR